MKCQEGAWTASRRPLLLRVSQKFLDQESLQFQYCRVKEFTMARGIEGNEISTPKATLKKSSTSTQSNKGQRSILGFFAKSTTPSGTTTTPKFQQKSAFGSTPAPSSDAVLPSSPIETKVALTTGKNKENGLPSPLSSMEPANGADRIAEGLASSGVNSPSREVNYSFDFQQFHTNYHSQAKKSVNYAESDDEDEDEPLKPSNGNRPQRRPSKRRRIDLEDSDDEFGMDAEMEAALAEAGEPYPPSESISGQLIYATDIDDFIVPDHSEDEVKPQKRKRSPQSKPPKSSPPPPVTDLDDDDILADLPAASTAQQWTYDPENPDRISEKVKEAPKSTSTKKTKEKAYKTDPDKRHPWLAKPVDADRNSPDHPDYDPRTLYIPSHALAQLSAFERQYWEIKSKFMETIVFFKKGKFYELYENDATIGHQLFDLKLTDRVNMRMVGVPESSLDHWANQFVAKGYRIARVDQMENALGKEMREREDKKGKKEEKIIRRELASVLTAGTLVDGGMLQDDMSTYCVAIKVRCLSNPLNHRSPC